MKACVRWAIAVLVMACSSDSPVGVSGSNPLRQIDLAIQSIMPAAGILGTTLDVRVFGQGFEEGSEIHFERDGVATNEIEANSTRFVDSRELVASITIDSLARTGHYTVVVVTTDDKRGIGLELFLAVDVVGSLLGSVTSIAHDVNENGEVVGFGQIGFCESDPCPPQHALYWSGGVPEDMGSGMAVAISGDCGVGSCRVVGQRDSRPVVWQKQAGAWASFELPTETGLGSASAINDRGDQIAGSMTLGGGLSTAVVWTESGGAWTATELPPAPGIANAINDVGHVVGQAAGRAIVWTSGGGGWTPHELQPFPGDAGALPRGINNAGDVVGESGSLFPGGRKRATLWKKTLQGWDLPIDLAPPDPEGGVTSSSAVDINDKGEIVGTIVDEQQQDIVVEQEAFLWTKDIGLLGLGMFEGRGTVATAISENNQIAGTNTVLALLWRFSGD